jgi:hypothetical protein
MTPARHTASLLLLPAALALLGPGCSPAPSKATPDLTVVEGTVRINGQPVPFATVTFFPLRAGLSENSQSSGVADASGRFRLLTNGTDGAYPGQCIVTVSEEALTPGNEGNPPMARSGLSNPPIPEQYTSPNKSTLKIMVKPDQKDYPVELTR